MTSSATATVLPPPLTDTPSVEALERLLAGLHQPMQRGVPSPPSVDQMLDLTVFDAPPAAAPPPPPPPPTTPAPAAPQSTPSTPAVPPPPPTAPPLSWSAGNARRSLGTPTTTAIGLAVATAAGVLAGLAAAGELAMP